MAARHCPRASAAGRHRLDAANNLYLEDNTACDVRRVDQATQTITTIAGQ